MNSNSILTLLPDRVNDTDESMVAAAVYVEAGEAAHAALIIRHNGEARAFHFFKKVLLEVPEILEEDQILIFVKELDFIPSEMVASFLAHCEIIKEQANPTFGFFYDARSFYDATGNYQNPSNFPEYMSCVGFCLTVIQSYLVEEQFLQYDDWDHTTYNLSAERMAYEMSYIARNYPEVNPDDIEKAVRRILPVEYFSAAYSDKRPVRKAFTDQHIVEIIDEISRRVA